LASRIKGNEQGKGKGNISLSEFLDIAACHHRTRLPATIQAAGRISEGDVSAHTGAKRSTGLHNNVVEESSKNKDTRRTEFRGKSGKVEDLITIAVDSTVKVTNREELIRDKWNKRRGFIKIHVAVNIKTKKIVSMDITKEDVVDGKMLKPLTRQAVLLITSSSSCMTINRVVGDG
jgi:hypothetical protein